MGIRNLGLGTQPTGHPAVSYGRSRGERLVTPGSKAHTIILPRALARARSRQSAVGSNGSHAYLESPKHRMKPPTASATKAQEAARPLGVKGSEGKQTDPALRFFCSLGL